MYGSDSPPDGWLIATEDRGLLDSTPLPLCTYTRGHTCELAAGEDYVGYATSDKANFFGFRLYLTTSVDQWWVLADGGYHSPNHKHWLQKQREITLVTLPRKNARKPWPKRLHHTMTRLRQRIKTALKILCIVFNLETTGLLCRITIRLLAYNLSLLTNVELATLKN